ncbi:MAG TPA: hypothetical protein DEF45_02630 [Rhodopirellula sp.]|nr:MAG: hypothetical protein CBD74_10700 [Saprospirales bacterium TMED214]HBV61896.1 hypothetical protein [Rhodopirellula sp.]
MVLETTPTAGLGTTVQTPQHVDVAYRFLAHRSYPMLPGYSRCLKRRCEIGYADVAKLNTCAIVSQRLRVPFISTAFVYITNYAF